MAKPKAVPRKAPAPPPKPAPKGAPKPTRPAAPSGPMAGPNAVPSSYVRQIKLKPNPTPLPGRRDKPPTRVAARPPTPIERIKKTPPSKRGVFKPNVRLDPSQISDRRGAGGGPAAGPNAASPLTPRATYTRKKPKIIGRM